MSKVVTSKFGERQIVQLPPVNFSRNSRSAEVPSIEPYSNHGNRGVYTNRSSSSIQNGQYGSLQTSQNIQPMARPEGNIVTDINNLGTGYNVVQPVNNVGPSMHYTPYAMEQQQQYQAQPQPPPQPQQYQTPQQQFQPPQQVPPPAAPVHSDTGHSHHSDGAKEKHSYYGPNGEVLPGPPPGVSMPTSNNTGNPKEKHIYYGPNGEVLPGPPQGSQMAVTGLKTEPQTDFVVEGVLQRGQLVTVYNVQNQGYLPSLPDYVLRTLLEKYGQFEITDVRIAYKGREYNIHGVPRLQVPMAMPPPQPPRPPQQIVEDATEEIVEYIYPGDKGYEEAKREMEHREEVGDRHKDRPVTMKEERRDRSHYTVSVPEKEYRGDRYYTRSIHPDDRGYRRVEYHPHDSQWWAARPGPEDEHYRRYYHGSYTAPDDYRRRAYTASDDPLEGLRWKKERATIAEGKKYNDDKKYTF